MKKCNSILKVPTFTPLKTLRKAKDFQTDIRVYSSVTDYRGGGGGGGVWGKKCSCVEQQ